MKTVCIHLMLGFFRLFALLPLRVLYVLSDMMYPVMRHVLRYRRKTVRKNLLAAFPDMSKTELLHIEKAFYHHLCDCVVETVKLLHISDAEMSRRVKVRHAELVEKHAADHRPIILYLGHYGNWEWGQEITRHYRHPGVSGELYRPLHSPVFDEVMKRIRSRYKTLLIPQKTAVRFLIRLHREHDTFLIGFIADQRPTRHSLHHWTTFLGQDTPYLVGGEEIGSHIGAAYLYLDVEKPRRGHYILTFKPITPEQNKGEGEKAAYPHTLQYLRMLEQTINREPAYWLWSHDRWKHKRTQQQTAI